MEQEQLTELTVAGLAAHIRAREVAPSEVTEAYLARIERHNPKLNAYITVTAERAREDARRADDEIASGTYRGPLHGVPIALKDLFATAGIRTTAGSKALADWVPESDSTPARKLREAGAVLLGKLNTHEFAAGYTTNNPWYGPTRNPWDTEHIPGGSSGGSGAAIAARLAAATLGTDTGGSIRVPAAFCGCVGLKPTYGRVSKDGVVPLSYLFDHSGPITRDVEDAALLLEAIAGYDPADANSVRTPVGDYTAGLRAGIEGLRIGIPENFFFEQIDDEVNAAVQAAIDEVRTLGADVRPVRVEGLDEAFPAWSTLLLAEVTDYHSPGIAENPDAYSPQITAWASAPAPSGTVVAHCLRTISDFTAGLRGLLEEVDLLLTPATPMPPPRIGDNFVTVAGQTHPTNDIGRFSVPFNASRLPALALPCGFTRDGLPIGLQFVGRPFDEATVLRAGYAYEQATEWHTARPTLK